MKNQNVIFSFLDTKQSFEFKNGFSFINNKKLFDVLKTENFRNTESSLVIKSLDNLKISEVFQIKINIKQIGYFLVNLPFEENAKDKYTPLIKEIECLKDNDSFENEKQLLKIEKVIVILNKYYPIFSIFVGRDDTFNYLKECNKVTPKFPLLFPQIVEDLSVKVIEKNEKTSNKTNFKFFEKVSVIFDIEKPFFKTDFLFDLLFALFISFSLYTTFAFFHNADMKGFIFLVQIFFYGFCLVYSLFLSKFKEKRIEHRGEETIIYSYIFLGSALGNLISFFIVRYALKMSDVPILALPIILSFVICLSALPLLKLTYNLVKKRK